MSTILEKIASIESEVCFILCVCVYVLRPDKKKVMSLCSLEDINKCYVHKIIMFGFFILRWLVRKKTKRPLAI